jgi:hypothetical protein
VVESIHRRQTVSCRERSDEIAVLIGRDVRGQEEPTDRRAREGLDTLFDGDGIILDGRRRDFDSERGRNRPRLPVLAGHRQQRRAHQTMPVFVNRVVDLADDVLLLAAKPERLACIVG